MNPKSKIQNPKCIERSLAPLRGHTIGFIGAGKMGQALMRGLLAQGTAPRTILVADPSATMRRQVRRLGVRPASGNCEVACRASVIVLAVKPQHMAAALEEIAPCLTPRQLVISIAAGMPLRWLQARARRVPVIRAMPNLAATVGCGFTAIALGRRAGARHRAMAQALFGAAGQVCELPERLFDAITAVSGSGPAYVFFLVRAWEEAARALGLPPAVAARAIRQTLTGSARLLEASGDSAHALIGNVASKGGTTEAALRVLARRRVSAHVLEALRAAARRSKALSWS